MDSAGVMSHAPFLLLHTLPVYIARAVGCLRNFQDIVKLLRNFNSFAFCGQHCKPFHADDIVVGKEKILYIKTLWWKIRKIDLSLPYKPFPITFQLHHGSGVD